MGDVDGDGRADVCARAAAGMRCWLSDGEGFPTRLVGPAWSNESGFDHVSYWSTIRLRDVDGDGRADLCARTADGFACHLSTGDGFGSAVMGPVLSDDSGWGDYDNYATIRMADLNGDGAMDLCARANAGMRCWLWDGSKHGTSVTGPELSNDADWNLPQHFRTLRLADVTGDGLADLCGRGAAGVSCWPSTGDGFGPEIEGPSLADSVGWAAERYYGTFRLAGPQCTVREEICNGVDDDCDGVVDEDACSASDGGTTMSDGGGPVAGDGGPAAGDGSVPGADGGTDPGEPSTDCGCRVVAPGADSPPTWAALLLGLVTLLGRRHGRSRRQRRSGSR